MAKNKAQAKILRHLEKGDGYWIKTIQTNRNGTHDILGCMPVTITPDMVGETVGVFVSIECKQIGERISPLQVHHQKQLEKAGARVGIAYNLDDALTIVEGLG